MSDEQNKFWDKFEKQGEAAVRIALHLHLYGERTRRFAQAWLEKKARQREEEAEERSEASIAVWHH